MPFARSRIDWRCLSPRLRCGEPGPETRQVRRSAGREPRQADQGTADRTDERRAGSRAVWRLAAPGGWCGAGPESASAAPSPRARTRVACAAPGERPGWELVSCRGRAAGRARGRRRPLPCPRPPTPPPRRVQGAAGGSAAASGPSSSSCSSISLPLSAVVMARRWSTKESPRWRSALVWLFLVWVYGKCPSPSAPLTEKAGATLGPEASRTGVPQENRGETPGSGGTKTWRGADAAEAVTRTKMLWSPRSPPGPRRAVEGLGRPGPGEPGWSEGVAGGLPDLGWRAPCTFHTQRCRTVRKKRRSPPLLPGRSCHPLQGVRKFSPG